VNATFTVSLSGGGSDLPVRVSYATGPGTATSPADFTAETGTVTFTPGDASQTITIAVRGDTLDENNETFSVILSSPVNASIQDGTGIGTINDDDAPPTLAVQDVRGPEGNAGTSPFTFNVTLSAPSAKTITVDATTAPGTATAPADYTHATTELTFNPGETSKTFTVLVNGDLAAEADEQFVVNLSGATNASIADGQATGTILNDDAPVGLPTVSAVYLSSTAWTAAFKSYLQSPLAVGSSSLGFAVPGGAGQLDEMPWVNLNEVSISFSQDVLVQADDLVIRGVNVANYSTDPAAFNYNAASRTATWRLPAGLSFRTDKILLDLDGSAPGGVATAGGTYLDGDWSNGADAYPSGDGTPAGDFRFRINVLGGDATRSGAVLADDFSQVKQKFFSTAANPGSGAAAYSVFHDVTGSGSILADDFSEVKKRFFNTLPAGEPALPAAGPSAAVGTDAALFGARSIRPSARSRFAADLLT
jgi:hypothetical protein